MYKLLSASNNTTQMYVYLVVNMLIPGCDLIAILVIFLSRTAEDLIRARERPWKQTLKTLKFSLFVRIVNVVPTGRHTFLDTVLYN